MFRSTKTLDPATRQRCVDYVRLIHTLTARQDHSASDFNTALAAAGGEVGSPVRAASSEMVRVARDIERDHAHASSVPQEALPAYLAWQQTWLDYRSWCEFQAGVLDAGHGVTSPVVAENRRLLQTSENSRRQAEKLEGQLLKRIKPDAAMVQDWMKQLYDDPRETK